MRKIFFVLISCIVMMCAADVQAQDSSYDFWKHRKFMRVGFAKQTFNTSYGYKLNSKFGIDYTSGRSYFLHKNPIAGLMKFAIDFGTAIDYVNYRKSTYSDDSYTGPEGYTGNEFALTENESSDLKDFGLHSLDFGFKVGPSLTVNPYDNIRVCAYFYFFPSASLLLRNTNFELGFMPYLDFGVEVSYKWIGLGFETRNGAGRYWDLMKMMGDEGFSSKKVSKYALNSYNFYLAFRF